MVLPPFEIGDVKDSILDLDQVTIDQFSCEYQVIEQKSYTLTYFSCRSQIPQVFVIACGRTAHR